MHGSATSHQKLEHHADSFILDASKKAFTSAVVSLGRVVEHRWKLRTVNMRPALCLRHFQPSSDTLQKDVNSCFTIPRLACHVTDMDGISLILKLKNCGEKMLLLRIDKRDINL